jgi:nucleoside-diphosphate-sugar epimerase
VARVLIVPCGCRGQALARDLVAAGHAVRGTTRSEARTAAIAALSGVTVVCWLLGRAPDPDLHSGRLRMLFEKLVDTPVRGVVYERAGEGEAIARDAAERWRIPVEVIDPGGDARAAVDRLLGL